MRKLLALLLLVATPTLGISPELPLYHTMPGVVAHLHPGLVAGRDVQTYTVAQKIATQPRNAMTPPVWFVAVDGGYGMGFNSGSHPGWFVQKNLPYRIDGYRGEKSADWKFLHLPGSHIFIRHLTWSSNMCKDNGEGVLLDTAGNSPDGVGITVSMDQDTARLWVRIADGSGTWAAEGYYEAYRCDNQHMLTEVSIKEDGITVTGTGYYPWMDREQFIPWTGLPPRKKPSYPLHIMVQAASGQPPYETGIYGAFSHLILSRKTLSEDNVSLIKKYLSPAPKYR